MIQQSLLCMIYYHTYYFFYSSEQSNSNKSLDRLPKYVACYEDNWFHFFLVPVHIINFANLMPYFYNWLRKPTRIWEGTSSVFCIVQIIQIENLINLMISTPFVMNIFFSTYQYSCQFDTIKLLSKLIQKIVNGSCDQF